MPILTVIVILVFFVVGLWAVNTYLPAGPPGPPLRLLANVVLIVIFIVAFLALTGVLGPVSHWRIN